MPLRGIARFSARFGMLHRDDALDVLSTIANDVKGARWEPPGDVLIRQASRYDRLFSNT